MNRLGRGGGVQKKSLNALYRARSAVSDRKGTRPTLVRNVF